MNKKIALLAVLICCGTFGFGQTRQTEREKQVIAHYQQVLDTMEEFQQFDYYYYNYAVKNLVDKEAIEFLIVHKGLREFVGTSDRSADEYNRYRMYYYKKMDELRSRRMSISQQDRDVLTEYSKRPPTRKRMLADKEQYAIYEDIVYNTIKEELTAQGVTCLDLARDLRERAGEGKIDKTVISKYKKVLACQSALTDELDKARLQEYLEMPVSRDAEPYYMPLTEWAK